MDCQTWSEKIAAYLDGELPAADSRALNEHLRGCSVCAANSLNKAQQKRAVHSAGLRYDPSPAFRARVQHSIASRRPTRSSRLWFPVLAVAIVMLIVGGIFLALSNSRKGELQTLSELSDLHVVTLASSNPVDVVSTDRHTVKPWFAGKIPFTFNLPDLQNSPFTLAGGKVSYLHQSPGAELVFHLRQHQISVFIFQEQALGNVRGDDFAQGAFFFTVRSWEHNGLRYFVIGDASPQDLDKLTELLKGVA